MSLLFIPDMNYDVQSIILDYKQQLDDFDKHKLKMKTVLQQLKAKLKCVRCSHIRDVHFFEGDTNFVRSPICECCLLRLRCIDLLELMDLFAS